MQRAQRQPLFLFLPVGELWLKPAARFRRWAVVVRKACRRVLPLEERPAQVRQRQVAE
jgi:hypothetical protein